MKKYTRHTIESVRELFSARGCELLEERYINYSTKMRYIATCGHEHSITLNNFKQGKGDLCERCRRKANAEKESTVTTEAVRAELEAEGCRLLSKSVTRSACKFRYVARCGHENEIDFAHFHNGGGGRVCAACSKSVRYPQSFVREQFTARGLVLLEDEYINCKTPLRYQTTSGHVGHVTFDQLLNGENQRAQKDGAAVPWRSAVFARDDYTCQVCGSRGVRLNAHHLSSYADNPGVRYEEENGVTLCESCHRAFHKTAGFGKNTREQFDSWRREYRGKHSAQKPDDTVTRRG